MRISDVSQAIRASSLNASDYAVYVTGLPYHATEEEVRASGSAQQTATATAETPHTGPKALLEALRPPHSRLDVPIDVHPMLLDGAKAEAAAAV